MPTVLFRSGWLIAGAAAVLVAAPVQAQEAATTSSGATHTVKRGDTLWDLSRAYLGDPFMWPEIYRVNTDVVEDPHWIYPGEVLRIPGRGVAQTPPPALTDDVTPVADADPVMDQQPQVVPVADEIPRAAQGATVFASSPYARRTTPGTARRAMGPEPQPVIRPGEHYAAPWVDRRGGPEAFGRIIAPVDIPGIIEAREPHWLFQHDRVYLDVPAGSVAAEGDRYMVYRLGANVHDGQQVVVPIGIVRVVATENGVASTARVVQQFEVIRVGDRIMPLQRVVLPVRTAPQRIDLGIEGQVVWIPSEAVLPSLQRYVVLDVTSADGVRLGDIFTLFRGRRTVDGATLPEEDVANVQIVHVNERGATGIIVDQRHPAIAERMPARLTARMP